jgi:hypothetical protein
MSWHFKGIARTSALSESTLVDGEQVVCLIYKDVEKGEIGRADIRLEEVDHFELPGELLGRWLHVIKKPGDGQTTVREKVASAEDFFFSLYASPDGTDSSEEVDALKYLLALMLERKRVVRAQGKRVHSGTQTYLHIKTKQTLDVPIIDISADLMIRIQETIGDIIL